MGRRVDLIIHGNPVRWKRPEQRVIPSRFGKPRVIRYSDPKCESEKARIAKEAMLKWRGKPACGPMVFRLVAIFETPKSWKKALREQAERGRVYHDSDPDLDQLVKLAMDALSGIVYHDDNQIVGFPGSQKRYGSPARIEISVVELDIEDAARTPSQLALEKKHGEGRWRAPDAAPRGKAIPSKTDKRGGS